MRKNKQVRVVNIVLISLILFVCNIISYSQTGWKFANNNPSFTFFNKLYFTNSMTGYAVGNSGGLIKTTDSGIHWLNISPLNISNDLYSLVFTDLNTGFICGNKYILKSTNSGNNWISVFNGNVKFYSISFLNNLTGYVSGDSGKLYRTINSGVNWNLINVINSKMKFLSVHFINSNSGFVSADSGKIYKTTNGGNNWQTISLETNYPLQYLNFPDNYTGFVSTLSYNQYGADKKIFKTTNSGVNWFLSDGGILPSENVRRIYFYNSNCGYAITSKLWRTTNSGLNWSETVNQDVQDIFMIDSINGFASVGNLSRGTKVMKTTNGGINLINIILPDSLEPGMTLFNLSFPNSTTGYIAAELKGIYKTTNGGFNWFHSSSWYETSTTCKFINGSTGTAQYWTSYYWTSNGGVNWSLAGGSGWPNYSFPKGIDFFNTSAGISAATNGRIFRTYNSGQSWEMTIPMPGVDLSAVSCDNRNTAFVVGSGGRIYKTSNGGSSWELILYNQQLGIQNLFTIDSSVVYFISNNGAIYKTTNSGATFFNQFSGANVSLNDICFINSNTGYIVGYGGTILKTTNAGNNWYSQISHTSNQLTGVDFSTPDTGYITAMGGIILKTTDAGGLMNISTEWKTNGGNILSIINYPNPFNNSTNIIYQLSEPTFARITVYDISGRVVNEFYYPYLLPGIYEQKWTPESISSGIYFLKIETQKNFVVSKLSYIR